MQVIKGSKVITDSISRILKINGEKYYEIIAPKLSVKHIKYNPDIKNNYQYKIKRSVMCDGTLYFVNELIFEIMNDLFNQRTHYKPTFPEDRKEEIKSIHYIMGDFEVYAEYLNFGTKDKPWLKLKFTVELPVSCEYIF